MTKNSPGKSLPVVPLVISGGVVIVGCVLLAIAFIFLLNPGGRSSAAAETATPSPTPVSLLPTVTMVPTAVPTATVEPTQEPAEESAPEETEPTDTPAPTAQDQPTTEPQPTAPPPPTDTPEPTATPENQIIKDVQFSLQSQTVAANESVVFNFSITNATNQEVQLGIVGVVVWKDGVNAHFHQSWVGWTLQPGKTDSWQDKLAIGTPGLYQLQLSICMSSVDECTDGAGDWQLQGQPIDLTIT
jgi:hypothetical protein